MKKYYEAVAHISKDEPEDVVQCGHAHPTFKSAKKCVNEMVEFDRWLYVNYGDELNEADRWYVDIRQI